MRIKKVKDRALNPRRFLERYEGQMSKMPVGKVLYLTYYGARVRIQRTGDGLYDYLIEPFEGKGDK